jgi:hypothetical protein
VTTTTGATTTTTTITTTTIPSTTTTVRTEAPETRPPPAAQQACASTAETTIDAPLAQILWADNNAAALVVSELGKLWYSNDDSVSWRAADIDSLVATLWAVDDAAKVIYALARDYVTLYVSIDGGASFVRSTNGTSLHDATRPSLSRIVAQKGTDGRILAAFGWTTECVLCNVDEAGYHANLYLSTNHGVTWTLIHEYVSPFGVVFSRAGNATSQLLYATLPAQRGDSVQCLDSCTVVAALFDNNATVVGRTVVFRNADAMQFIEWHGTSAAQDDDTAVVVERLADVGDGVRVLSITHDAGRTWLTASVPIAADSASSRLDYSVIAADASSGDIIIVTDSADNSTGSLFLSRSPSSTQFVSVLPHVQSTSLGALASRSDVETNEDVAGTIFANAYAVSDDGSADKSCLRTRVTQSYGSQWRPLVVNSADCDTYNITAADCYLQAFGVNADDYRIGRIYTTAGAHGVWFAVGHFGRCLDLTRPLERTLLFVSNDGGDTWSVLGSGQQTYEIAGYGTLVVVADTSNAQTDQYRVSFNYAKSFQTCPLSSTKLEVQNVITRVVGNDLDSSTTSLLLYGRRPSGDNSGAWNGVLVSLHFSDSFARTCQASIADAGQPASDYELWSPHMTGDNEQTCVLGSRVQFARKKDSANCSIPLQRTLLVSSEPCACAPVDYQCDFCFLPNRNSFSMPSAGRPTTACVASASAACAAQPNGVPAGECGVGDATYVPKSGYLRVPNDNCDDKLSGATRFDVAAPKPCPTPVTQCSQLSCGACATADNCLWCAQSVAGSVDWSVGTCVDVKSSTNNFCTQNGVFVAYSARLCMDPPATPAPNITCSSVARDQANLACAQVCGDHNLAVQTCPCDASHELGKTADIVCANGCTPPLMAQCANTCRSQGSEVRSCKCNGADVTAECQSINGPDFIPGPKAAPNLVPGDGVFAIMFFMGFIVLLIVIFIAYRLSIRGRRN